MKRAAMIAALSMLAVPQQAFSQQASALDAAIGRAMFRRAWVSAPSSTTSNDGLGPLFNARSCAACHQGLDRAPIATDAKGAVVSPNLVLRLSDQAGGADPRLEADPGKRPPGHPRPASG